MPSMRMWKSGILTFVLHVKYRILCFQSGRKINSNIILTFCFLGTNLHSIFCRIHFVVLRVSNFIKTKTNLLCLSVFIPEVYDL